MAASSEGDDERRNYTGSAWNIMYEMPQDRLADFGQSPEHLRVPIAVTPQSGKPAGSLSYDVDQARRGFPALLVAQPPPSPLQQWVREHGPKDNPAYSKGAPVRLVHMTSPATSKYNGLVGDIYNVRDTADGMSFDVRCPLYPGIMNEHGVSVSNKAMGAARENRGKLAGEYNMSPEQAKADDGENNELPPYIQVGSLGSEKLDSLITGAAAQGITKFVMPPVWGKPLSKEELQALEHQLKPRTAPAAAHSGCQGNQVERGPRREDARFLGPSPTLPGGYPGAGPCGVPGGFHGGPMPPGMGSMMPGGMGPMMPGGMGPMMPGGGSMMGGPMGFPGPYPGPGMHPGMSMQPGMNPFATMAGPGMHPGMLMQPGMNPFATMAGPGMHPGMSMQPGMNPFATMAPFP